MGWYVETNLKNSPMAESRLKARSEKIKCSSSAVRFGRQDSLWHYSIKKETAVKADTGYKRDDFLATFTLIDFL